MVPRTHKQLSKSRTSDHIFSLKTLINKYVHNTPKGKTYACFVDFKKPMMVFGRRVSSENLNT